MLVTRSWFKGGGYTRSCIRADRRPSVADIYISMVYGCRAGKTLRSGCDAIYDRNWIRQYNNNNNCPRPGSLSSVTGCRVCVSNVDANAMRAAPVRVGSCCDDGDDCWARLTRGKKMRIILYYNMAGETMSTLDSIFVSPCLAVELISHTFNNNIPAAAMLLLYIVTYYYQGSWLMALKKVCYKRYNILL